MPTDSDSDDDHTRYVQEDLGPGMHGDDARHGTQTNGSETHSDTTAWLPDDSDSDGEGRTGLFSTRTEIHTTILGVGAGLVAAQIGIEALTGLVGGALGLKGLDRYSETVSAEIKHEPWYFIAAAGVGYVVAVGLGGPP